MPPFAKGYMEEDDPLNEDGQQSRPVKTTSFLQLVFTNVVLLLVGFLAGFVPMWLMSRGCVRSLSRAQNQWSLARIQNALASAVIDVRRGDYESARQAASRFFTSLRAEADAGAHSALSPAQKEAVPTLLARRDEIVTLLARGDSAAADLLADLHVSYRKIVE